MSDTFDHEGDAVESLLSGQVDYFPVHVHITTIKRRRRNKMNWIKYKPENIPEGYRLEVRNCFKCNGTKFYSGVYGQTACDDCTRGKVFRLVKMRVKKEKK